MKRLTVICLILCSAVLFISATNKYPYNSDDPVSVVLAASQMILNADYAEMLSITSNGEYKKTMDTVEQMRTDSKVRERVIQESKKLLKFELIRMETMTNEGVPLAVVSTRWVVKVSGNKPRNPNGYVGVAESADPAARRRKAESEVFVEYLLKNFNGEWKIISKRTR